MHGAPSVTYPVGRSALAGGLIAATCLAAAATLLAWTWQAPFGGRQLAGWLLLALASALAGRCWLASPVGQLAWDGAGWQWRGAGKDGAGEVAIALDLQRWMLLQWRPARGATRWFWLEQDEAPAHWDALRRAVYSPARTDASSGAKPPAAIP